MKIFERSGDLQLFLDTHRSSNKKVALVPTMGGLHDGHLRLVEKAQSLSDVVVESGNIIRWKSELPGISVWKL